ncbi:peptidase S8/S53 domain-containing protein [Syncephalis fuscata]|nr:peptidase S8/S53 domain-containing protein [Syncephalis fuscata]
MGFKGKGVKLGIIDSGANKNSIAFKENFKYKHNFVVTAHNQTEDSSECTKRGKRLTGIVIANSNYFTGIAPEVTFGSYRVFGCKGPTSTSLVLQAIKAAIKDQMKIIVLPEIAIVDEYDTQLGQEIEDAAKHGVIMIVAASVNNFKSAIFSYQGLPVLSVGGFKQEYRKNNWPCIEFTSSCSNMSYNFNKEADIIPKNIKGKLIEYTGLKRQDIALVWYDKSKMPYFLEYAKSIGMAGLIIVNVKKMLCL